MVRIGDLPVYAILMVIAGITLSIGADVTADISATQTSGTIARAAVDNATSGLGNVASQLPTVGTVIGLAVIIAVLLTLLSGAFRGGRTE